MNEAIKLAMQNGWTGGTRIDNSPLFLLTVYRPEQVYEIVGMLIFIDPLFWKALGEAMGWGKTERVIWSHRWLDEHFAGLEAEEIFWKELIQ